MLTQNILHHSLIHKTAYQSVPLLPKYNRHFVNRFKKNPQTDYTESFSDILTPLNPLHGGIGFTALNELSSHGGIFVQIANRLKSDISKKNANIIHGYVFINDNDIIEASPQNKNNNGRNEITETTKNKSLVYISKFPMLNMMLVQEMENLQGGGYNFVGTVNCVIGEKIVPPLRANDFFCSQMIMKALKNALVRYEKTPLLPNKDDIKIISKNIENLDPDLTLPAEIKQTFDKMPQYFIIIPSTTQAKPHDNQS